MLQFLFVVLMALVLINVLVFLIIGMMYMIRELIEDLFGYDIIAPIKRRIEYKNDRQE